MNSLTQDVQNLLNQAVTDGHERGVQVAVYHNGEPVVDAAAGFTDADKKTPVDCSTLFPVFSVTKGIAATLANILVSRGVLSFDDPVSRWWPGFGCNGKENITLRHVLNHSAGLMNMPAGAGPDDIIGWDAMCEKIAGQTPAWTPGSEWEYHAVSFSWLVGEPLQRASGRSFAQLLDDEIRRPLDLDEMFVGMPDGISTPVAVLDEPEPDPDMLAAGPTAPIPSWMCPLHAWMNTETARRACVPASNGIMSARAVAKHYAALVPGGVDGVELLNPDQVRTATEPQRLNDGTVYPRGLGYQLGSEDSVMGERPTIFGHGGYGGAIAFADPEHRFAFALTKNFYTADGIMDKVIKLVREKLGIPG